MEQPAAVSRALKYGSRLSGDHTVIVSFGVVFASVRSVVVCLCFL